MADPEPSSGNLTEISKTIQAPTIRLNAKSPAPQQPVQLQIEGKAQGRQSQLNSDLDRVSSPKRENRNQTGRKFNYHIQLPVMPTFKVIPESFRPHREPG